MALTRMEQELGQRFRVSEIVMLIYKCYFQRARMRGNRNENFFDSINVVFVCFVAATIQHCLKEWRTGKEPTELVEFKYETAAGKLISDAKDKSKTDQLHDHTTTCAIPRAFMIGKSGD